MSDLRFYSRTHHADGYRYRVLSGNSLVAATGLDEARDLGGLLIRSATNGFLEISARGGGELVIAIDSNALLVKRKDEPL